VNEVSEKRGAKKTSTSVPRDRRSPPRRAAKEGQGEGSEGFGGAHVGEEKKKPEVGGFRPRWGCVFRCLN